MGKIAVLIVFLFTLFYFSSCKKDKITNDSDAKVQFSQDSVLFDTVFTSIGSSTRNIRVRNRNNQRIKISAIELQGGAASPFIINVDGAKGTSFADVEIAAHDSLYIFIQVNVNPTNSNSPMIISDALIFLVNGNTQTLPLEAWGQDAYYHRPTSAIKFTDGSYLSYSLVDDTVNGKGFTFNGFEYVWKNDKPHVIYGFLVVDSTQKLMIPAGTHVYMNYKAGLWVYRYGQIRILGQKGKEVIFQGARREKDYADEPGQWDRIWINEGSLNNVIDYAIIKNAYVGVQAETFGNTLGLGALKITNTKIQNMSLWGLYGLGYKIEGGNNVISNCQEHCLNLLVGGEYSFIHCTFANYWSKEKSRDKPTVNLNNYTTSQVLPGQYYFGNCIIDGKLANEISLDFKPDAALSYTFSNSFLKTTNATSDAAKYLNVRTGPSLQYKDIAVYNFEPDAKETQIKGFDNQKARSDVIKFPLDLNLKARIQQTPTAGAYEF